MLSASTTFLIAAVLAGILGFAGIVGAAVGLAKILFITFLLLFLESLLVGGPTLRKERPVQAPLIGGIREGT